MAPPISSQTDEPHWWQRWWFLLAMAFAAGIPLIIPQIPPLIDLPSHIGRFRVQLAIDHSPSLARYFDFHWMLIGNLGLDLLVIPLSKLFGLELAVKLVVLSIPPLTVAGFLWVAREIHGRVPATAFFALPLAYNYPFQFGFANFTLSTALSFLAFALWLRLGRLDRKTLRAALFVPLVCVIWICHAFGWAILCLLVYAAEIANARDRGANYFEALFRAGIASLPLAPPIILMILWRSSPVAGKTGDWFHWPAKGHALASLLRELYEHWDRFSALVVMLVPLTAVFWRQIRFSHKLGLATLFLMLAFIFLPRVLLGSAYADMRISPYLFAVAILAIGPIGVFRERWSTAIAAVGVAFFVARLSVTTYAYAELDAVWRAELHALDHVATGSRVLTLTATPCDDIWRRSRTEHLGSMAIVRRDAFTNDQWVLPGAQLLSIRYMEAYPFAFDPSQIIRPSFCRGSNEGMMSRVPDVLRRGVFDYAWLIEIPEQDWPKDPRLIPIWRHGSSVLYRVAVADEAPRNINDTAVDRHPLLQ